ncbi:TFIIH basal transcription factor complex, subunit SSL1 [Westerdykella ornata]|uniref:General transcription and DNA repair factor IIH n=1 Tax=Westerdykella ornata TaxID=318751 RepID=A0A6A6JCL6_WESOR|nr:TFIIH basal transcription factor complex, subunit SSL1 [Westerdykella ornata]KAF2274172.1 TFIIH basal transcription factor complex, subunit SSL1 [Westerdykella ornata]
MADSDYDFEEDASDDEYIGSKAASGRSSRASGAVGLGKRKTQEKEKGKATLAWERRGSEASIEYDLELDGDLDLGEESIRQSVQEKEEERKRKRLRKDTKPFQRGIIRHVVLVLDLSEAMLEKDMRPNRYITMIKYTQEYVREFFEQNPISQMSVLGMHDGLCIRVSELSGNPADHIAAIQGLRFPRNPKDIPKEPKGSPSLQNALELARATLYHTPSHGTREVIIVFGSLLSLDPGDIHQTIKACVRDRIRVSIIGMSARLRICQEIVSRTNAGDESEYVVATDQELLRELLLATTTPPVVRKDRSAASAESTAALMMMGFPSRVVQDVPTLCACHGVLTSGGYTCPRCAAKVCSLPVTCPSCQLTLLLSTHLARSYHHLFPLRNWAEVSWRRAREKGSVECVGCLAVFPKPPPEDPEAGARGGGGGDDEMAVDGPVGGGGKKQAPEDEEESEEQRASESSRYECRVCESHFCIDCDMFCHMVLHNCPGCLSHEPGAG